MFVGDVMLGDVRSGLGLQGPGSGALGVTRRNHEQEIWLMVCVLSSCVPGTRHKTLWGLINLIMVSRVKLTTKRVNIFCTINTRNMYEYVYMCTKKKSCYFVVADGSAHESHTDGRADFWRHVVGRQRTSPGYIPRFPMRILLIDRTAFA